MTGHMHISALVQDRVVLHKSISEVLCNIHKRFSARYTLTSLQDTPQNININTYKIKNTNINILETWEGMGGGCEWDVGGGCEWGAARSECAPLVPKYIVHSISQLKISSIQYGAIVHTALPHVPPLFPHAYQPLHDLAYKSLSDYFSKVVKSSLVAEGPMH